MGNALRVLLIERQNGYRMYEVHDGNKWWSTRQTAKLSLGSVYRSRYVVKGGR